MVTIIVPVYNESRQLLHVLELVKNSDTSPREKEIIVVDDGSTDGSGEILRDYCDGKLSRLITLPRNMGKTFAVMRALSEAKGDIVLIQDADLEYSPSDYRQLLEPFEDHSVQVVYGSRFLHSHWPKNMKPAYWIANKLFTLATNLLFRTHITDEGTAYKAFRREILQSIQITGKRFAFCPEVTAKVLLKKIKIMEVPISYSARDKKQGKKPRTIDGINILWTLIKCRISH